MSILEQLQYFDAHLRFDLKVPTKCQLEKTARRIESLVDTLPAAPGHIPQQLIDSALSALQAQIPSSLSNKEIRVFCIAGLSQIDNVENPDFVISCLVNDIGKRVKSSLFRALLSGYLQIADLDFSWVGAIRSFLKSNVEKLPRKWVQRCERYGLLDESPCLKLSRLFRDSGVDFNEELSAAGLNGALRTTGIGRKLLYVLCDELKATDWLCSDDAEKLVEKFINIITQDGKVVYLGANSQLKIVEAFLTPCLSQLPDAHIQKAIERFLLGAYSDPRVNPAKWAHVPDELTEVIKRWLTKQAMGLLLEVLNRTADDAHWESRNEFWNFYIENDLVEEAWVIFGPNAYEHAKDLVVSSSDFNAGTFGTIKRGGGQVQPNHSVLLMRIDNVVIAEWTHNGKVRLWERGNLSPAFYRQGYTADELRGMGIKYRAKEEYAHYSRWQEKVDKFIYEYTGIRHGDVAARLSRVRPQVMNKPRIRRSAVFQSESHQAQQADVTTNTRVQSVLPTTGTCKNCGKTKPASEFFVSKRRPGKLTVFCKQCSKENR